MSTDDPKTTRGDAEQIAFYEMNLMTLLQQTATLAVYGHLQREDFIKRAGDTFDSESKLFDRRTEKYMAEPQQNCDEAK